MSERISTRRKFFLKAGAAMSAPAAFTTGISTAAAGPAALEEKLVKLEDEMALRRLRSDTIVEINRASRDVLDELEQGLRQIVADHEIDATASVVVSADRAAASMCVPCTVRLEAPIEAPGSSLVDMARLQGEGVLSRTEARVLEIACTRTSAGWELGRVRLRSA